MKKGFTQSAIGLAEWLNTFPEGDPFLAGHLTPNREDELVKIGSLIETEDPKIFKIGHVDTSTIERRKW